MDGAVEVSDTVLHNSPQNAVFFVGNSITNVALKNVTVDGVGSFVLQTRGLKGPDYATLGGCASFERVVASGVGFYPVYDCAPEPAFIIDDRGGNSGWLTSCTDDSACHGNSTCQGPASAKFCAHCGFPPAGVHSSVA